MSRFPKWLAGARHAFGAWRASGGIYRHITLSSLILAVLLLATAGIIAFGALHLGLHKTLEADIELDGTLIQQRLENGLNGIARHLGAYAQSVEMAGALAGANNDHAASFLNAYKPPSPHLVAMAILDRQGRLIAGKTASSSPPPEVTRVLHDGRPQSNVTVDATGRQLLHLAFPIPSGAGSTPAGVLLAALDLDNVFADAAQTLSGGSVLRELTAGADSPSREHSGYFQRTLAARLVAPMDTVGLQVRIGRPAASVHTAIHRAAVFYGVLCMLTLAGTWYAAHRFGRKLASPTVALNRSASQIASSENPMMITGTAQDGYLIRYVNPAFVRLTGYSMEEVVGRNCSFLQGGDDDQPELDVLRDALQQEREARVVLRNVRKDGSCFWNELSISPVRDADGRVTHFVGEMVDVTARREEQAQLEHQATHDPLTGLPNRNLLTDRLMQAISYAQRYQRMVAVAFLDLDKFKHINDTMGHDAGDQLLKIVAGRLSACVRDSDTVARLGGDEFVLVLYDQANEDITYHAMQRVLGSISQPMEIGGRELNITCSIGFAVFPQDGRDAETLIKNADTAMYRAKELGRDNFQFYTDELHTRINERLAMETGLRRALEHDEFELHYQPRVDLSSGKVTALEALIRWNHPELGQIEPRRFVPLAEELGLIHRIGEWVLRQSCRQQAGWQKDGVADLPISVNISAAQFLHKDFTKMVARILLDTPLDASRLELEITESLSMQDPEASIRVLRELRHMGVRVSIDDFGTGYSNLTYMKQFPVDIIKLDQSFVRDIVRNPEDLAISNAVIAMAHSLHLKVTAEGVESVTQLALLAAHGCDEMQGFYFSPALAVDRCTDLLREHRMLPMEKLGRRQANHTILLVDDEPHVLSALERILRRTGCRILTAGSALDAFDLMAMHEVGVILSDQRMPEMTGVEFFARIRDMYPATVRMILSGYADIDAVTNAINIGAVYKFLNKPWDANELCDIVNEAFEKYEDDLQRLSRGMERRATMA